MVQDGSRKNNKYKAARLILKTATTVLLLVSTVATADSLRLQLLPFDGRSSSSLSLSSPSLIRFDNGFNSKSTATITQMEGRQQRQCLHSLLLSKSSSSSSSSSLSQATTTSTPSSTTTTTTATNASSSSNQSTDNNSITSNIISKLAVLAIKNRLRAHTDVQCFITTSSSPSDVFMKGIIGPVTIKGKGWSSPTGALTCTAIEATVEQCQLDIKRIVSDRKLLLTTPTTGKAMVALNGIDFSTFLLHPLMKDALALGIPDVPVQFTNDPVTIDPIDSCVQFYALYKNEKWKCTLRRHSEQQQTGVVRKACVEVTRIDSNYSNIIQQRYKERGGGDEDENEVAAARDSAETLLTDALTSFFNEMIFELDGTFLSYRDMMITTKGKSPLVMLALNILVKKFPSPGLEF